MAVVTPSQISAANVNAELAVSLTSQINLSNNSVHNIAAVPMTLISTSTLDATTLGAVQSVTAPSNATFARIRLWGGGGGSTISSPYGGGGGGGFALKFLEVVGGSTVASCVVGLRGQPANPGTAGGTTTVTVNSVNYSATGGAGSTSGGVGGSGTNGDINETGLTATGGFRPTRGGDAGGQSYGGGLGGLGVAGQTPGGGGGTSNAGANFGGHGRVIIDWYRPNTINFSALRWGINFPGRNNNILAYNTSNVANIDIEVLVPSNFTGRANSALELHSNGTLIYRTSSGSPNETTVTLFSRTWLTSGVNADYTANIVLSSGAFSAGSSAASTDHSLGTTRRWFCLAISPAGGITLDTEFAIGNLIIKNEGIEIFRRPIRIHAETMQFPILP